MGIADLTRSLAEMAGKVRSGSFAVNDLKGGTFTISNLGAIGGQYSTPIVNVPEVAILLVGRSRKLPVVMPDDSIQARLMMPLEPLLRPPLGRRWLGGAIPQRGDRVFGSTDAVVVGVVSDPMSNSARRGPNRPARS